MDEVIRLAFPDDRTVLMDEESYQKSLKERAAKAEDEKSAKTGRLAEDLRALLS